MQVRMWIVSLRKYLIIFLCIDIHCINILLPIKLNNMTLFNNIAKHPHNYLLITYSGLFYWGHYTTLKKWCWINTFWFLSNYFLKLNSLTMKGLIHSSPELLKKMFDRMSDSKMVGNAYLIRD